MFCQAVGTRDAIAKCLYSALFDWIVLQVNQALVSKRDFSEHKVTLRCSHNLMAHADAASFHNSDQKLNYSSLLSVFSQGLVTAVRASADAFSLIELLFCPAATGYYSY